MTEPIRRLVLTGGPCAGKSLILAALERQFGNSLVGVPEVATTLLQGMPVPGKDVAWSRDWQTAFQLAVFHAQVSFEATWELAALERGARVLVCDRGLLDGGGYWPDGLDDFCRTFAVDRATAFARYSGVIHLESLATHDAAEYDRLRQATNAVRFESVERAIELEHAFRRCWHGHPVYHFIPGQADVGLKIVLVQEIVAALLGR